MCKYIPTASLFYLINFSKSVIICLPTPNFLYGSNTLKVKIYAWFCYLNSSTLVVQAPIAISLQQQYLESFAYCMATFTQNGVLYFTGRALKLIFLSKLMFFSFISPNVRFIFYFSVISLNLWSLNNSNIILELIIIMKYSVSNIVRRFSSASQKSVTLTFFEEQKLARVCLSNPKKRNTLSLQAIQLLKGSLAEVQLKVKEKKAKILILEAEGPVFCSGHDLKQLSSSTNPKKIFDSSAELMLKLRNLSIPTLCSINGIAAAAGFQMAMACDLIVATQKSSFSTPGIKWGLFCSTPGVQLIRSINSEKKARQMLFFGEPISANEAYQYGLVNKVVPEDKLEETIKSFVTKVGHLSGEVISHGKKVLSTQQSEDIEKAYCIAGEGMDKNIREKEDCQEGLKAFSQKRHPHYKN